MPALIIYIKYIAMCGVGIFVSYVAYVLHNEFNSIRHIIYDDDYLFDDPIITKYETITNCKLSYYTGYVKDLLIMDCNIYNAMAMPQTYVKQITCGSKHIASFEDYDKTKETYACYHHKNLNKTEDRNSLNCYRSVIDNKYYCVRKTRHNIYHSINLLANVTKKTNQLIQFLNDTYPTNENITAFITKYKNKELMEILPNNQFITYIDMAPYSPEHDFTIGNAKNKISVCLNKYSFVNETNKDTVDIDTLTYIAFYKLAHLPTLYGNHDYDFWSNLKFILESASKNGIYQPIDYKTTPQVYCGMTLNYNPYFDKNL